MIPHTTKITKLWRKVEKNCLGTTSKNVHLTHIILTPPWQYCISREGGGGDSPEKWVGVLNGTFRVWNSNPAQLLESMKSSRPPWHLLGSDFVLWKLKIQTFSEMNAPFRVWNVDLILFAPFRVQFQNFFVKHTYPLFRKVPPGCIYCLWCRAQNNSRSMAGQDDHSNNFWPDIPKFRRTFDQSSAYFGRPLSIDRPLFWALWCIPK